MITIIKRTIEILHQLESIMNRQQKVLFFCLFCVTWIGACFEALGVTAILPFIQILLTPEKIIDNKHVVYFASCFHIDTVEQTIMLLGMGVIFIYLIKNAYLVFLNYVSSKYQVKVQKELTSFILKQYMRRPYIYFVNHNTADIMRNIDGDTSSISMLLQNLLKVLTEILTSILICSIIISTDVHMALGIMILVVICVLGISRISRKVIKKNGIKQRTHVSLKYKSMYELLNGMKEIQIMNRRSWFARSYEKNLEKVCDTIVVQNIMGALPERIIEAVCVTGLIGMVCFRILNGAIPSEFVPQLAVFAVAAFRILPSMARIIAGGNMVLFYRSALQSTYENLGEIERYNNEQQEILSQGIIDDSKQRVNFLNTLEIEGVSWKYPDTDKNVLENANLLIIRGQAIALIGESGSGKTTLADIILGLLSPQSGRIMLDGIDIKTIPKNWSRLIGFVPQNVFLSDDTVRNNIAFGLPTEEINDELIWDALDQAQLRGFIENLPKQLDTIVGEQGIKFSGGQKQRVAIARALYNKPEILVLDEATAALDTETETAVMESIDALRGQITMIIVAHRLTTIRRCDKIYEVRNGIVEERDRNEVLVGIK